MAKNSEKIWLYLDGEKIAESNPCTLTKQVLNKQSEGWGNCSKTAGALSPNAWVDKGGYAMYFNNELLGYATSLQEVYQFAKEVGIYFEEWLVKPEK